MDEIGRGVEDGDVATLEAAASLPIPTDSFARPAGYAQNRQNGCE